MRLLQRPRRCQLDGQALEDPIAGVANLFDASIVFIVSMMIALFMAYNMMDLLDPISEVTIIKKKEKRQWRDGNHRQEGQGDQGVQSNR